MKNKLLNLLLGRKKTDISGKVIYGRKREVNVAVNSSSRKLYFDVIGKKDDGILSAVKGLNVEERNVYSNKISMIRRSQIKAVQSHDSCLQWEFARKLFEN